MKDWASIPRESDKSIHDQCSQSPVPMLCLLGAPCHAGGALLGALFVSTAPQTQPTLGSSAGPVQAGDGWKGPGEAQCEQKEQMAMHEWSAGQ